MELLQLNPFVRYIDKRSNIPSYTDFVVAYDNRFIYALNGHAEVITEKETFILRENEALLLSPTIPYKLNPSSDFSFFIINFDALCENTDSVPVTAPNIASFDRKKVFSEETLDNMPLFLRCKNETKSELEKIYDLYIKKPVLFRELISAEFKKIIITSVIFTEYDKTPELIKNVLSYIDKNYKNNITNSVIAEIFSYHPNYINRIFKEHTGKTLKAYITDLKLSDAKKLLKTTHFTVNEISEMCGFESYSYFIKLFRIRFGSSPLKYRKQNESHL